MADLPPVLREPITTPDQVWTFFREVAPWQQIRWGTERVERLLDLLGHPETTSRYVIVGGTNAKGSTTLYLAALLEAMGHPTGATLSPHISDLTERIHLRGEFIPVPALVAACERLRQARVAWPPDEDSTPTYHECWTAAAVQAFASAGLEWGILEVGMGGRYDAARAVPSEVAVITPISFDHMQFLGDTLTAIAIEKAEIVAEGGLLVTAPQSPEPAAVLTAKARIVGATHLRLEDEVALEFPAGESIRPVFTWRRGDLVFDQLQTGLWGRYQVMNASVALLTVIGMVDRGLLPRLPLVEEVRAALASVTPSRHPARFERLATTPELWCEGGHNPAALEVFVRDFAELRGEGPLTLLLGFKWDKNAAEALATLARLRPTTILITESHQMDPKPAAEVADLARAACPAAEILPIPALPDAAREWVDRVRATPEGLGLVTGSLYLCGDVRRLASRGDLGAADWQVPALQLPERD